MGHPLRWNCTDLVYEVTLETIQGRYLLRPSREVRDLILGVLSRAQVHYGAIRLYAFLFTRNRATLLLSTAEEEQLAMFMGYLAGEISRKVGRLLDWSGKLWAGRYRCVPVLDEDAINERLRHVLSQGVEEGLVASPKDWPGASCVPALLRTMTLEGAWIDRDREARLRTLGIDPPPSACVHPYRVTLSPIPAWATLAPAELVAHYQAMIESIELEHLFAREGIAMDPVELQRQDPFFRPAPTRAQRVRKLCHATVAALVTGFKTAYRQFCAAFRTAAAALAESPTQRDQLVAEFPAGCHPRPALRAPLADNGRAPWWTDAPPPDVAETHDERVPTEIGAEPATTRWVKVVDRHRTKAAAAPAASAPRPVSPARRRHAAEPTRPLEVARPPPPAPTAPLAEIRT